MGFILSCARVTQALFPLTVPDAISRIQAREPQVRAFIHTRLSEARAEHAARAAAPKASVLHGVPFSLKDEWETLCLPTTAGSWRHRRRRSPVDSRVMRVFDEAGAILVGKSNLSDYGLVPESASWVGGPSRNPHDATRTAGGSSGGAAAAIADGMVAFDWGTDIGGSIRIPAAYCGLYGLRLSSETWPVTELFPAPPPALTSMLAQGPMARNLAQISALLDVAAPRIRTGRDRGPFVPREAVLYTVREGGLWPGFAADLAEPLRRALGRVSGSEELPSPGKARWIYNSVWCSHFDELLTVEPELGLWRGLQAVLSAVLFRGRLGDKRFHPATAEVLLQVALGRALLFRDKRAALAAATDYRERFERIWARGGVVVMPVSVWPPPRLGTSNRNPRILECTMPGNLVDATGLAIPWGRFPDGLPRGVQLLGPPGSERALVALAQKLALT
jgi:Asp-tRNA(Asn)/Glu-tRNA(Gln) amidotransferase A subunit family amidase